MFNWINFLKQKTQTLQKRETPHFPKCWSSKAKTFTEFLFNGAEAFSRQFSKLYLAILYIFTFYPVFKLA